jgi:hypothetical protein
LMKEKGTGGACGVEGAGMPVKIGADLAFGGGSAGDDKSPVLDFGGGRGGDVIGAAGALALAEMGDDFALGGGKGGAESWLVFVLVGKGGRSSKPVCDFVEGSGTAGKTPVRALGGGRGGTPASRPVRACGEEDGGESGVDWALGDISKGCVTIVDGVIGRSTRRSEAVGRLTWIGAGEPSGRVGRPGAPTTPVRVGLAVASAALAEGTAMGVLNKDSELAVGSAATGAVREGWGAFGSGIGGGGVCAKTRAGGGAETESGGGVAKGGGIRGGGVARGAGSVRATEGSVWVAGNAGGLDWWDTGSNVSDSSTLPLWTKTFALGFAITTRGGADGTLPEGAVMGVEVAVSPGFATILVGARSPSAGDGGSFCGKSGVVLAAGGEPVNGGAAGRAWGSAIDGGRETFGMGLVTAVDQAGGTFWTGAGVRLAPVLIGSVVAAEMLGRPAIWAEVGLSGRGGRLIRNVWRFGAFGSLLSGPVGSAGSAILVAFYSLFRKMFNGEIGNRNIFSKITP